MKKYILPIIITAIVVWIGSTYINSRLYSSSGAKKLTSQEFSKNITGLPDVKNSETVELKDGDTYSMTATIVKKNINGKEVKMLAYNGMIPGPLIKVKKDSEITLNLTNKIDVDTTLHPHGVRLDNKFDGTPDITQKPIKVGQTFAYKIKFPDVGIYWYHPHIREDYTQELGMYGNFLVEPTDQNYYSPVNKEEALFLDDILLDKNTITPFFSTYSNFTLTGRFGNTMLINGQTDYKLVTNQGDVVRMYITNAANTRIFNFSIPSAKLKLVGSDNGKYEKEEYQDTVMIAPSERAIVEAYFPATGTYSIENKTPNNVTPLGSVAVNNDSSTASYVSEFTTLRTNQDTMSAIDPYRADFDKNPDKNITLSVLMEGMNDNSSSMMVGHMMHNGMQMSGDSMSMNSGQKIEWEDTMQMMNVMSNSQTVKWKIIDNETKKENEDINWTFNKGDKVKIRITNDPKSAHPMQHPIHFHGQKFLVLSTNGVKNTNLVWKDTTLIQNGDTVDILLDASNPGNWMAHCHIPEHLESGMMIKYSVKS